MPSALCCLHWRLDVRCALGKTDRDELSAAHEEGLALMAKSQEADFEVLQQLPPPPERTADAGKARHKDLLTYYPHSGSQCFSPLIGLASFTAGEEALAKEVPSDGSWRSRADAVQRRLQDMTQKRDQGPS